jgi:hypothetical protein
MDRARLTLIGLCAVTILCYWPAFSASFVHEDDHALEATAVWTIPGRGLSQWTVDAIGPDAGRQHALNLGLHLVVGVLVYAVAAELVAPPAALLAAAVFLLHPVNSEAVSYISARGDLFVALWSLVAVWGVLRGGLFGMALGGLSLVAAAMSKEIGLIAIPLTVWTLLVFRRGIPAWVQPALWCALGLVVGAAWYRMVSWITTIPGAGGPVFDLPTFALLQLTAVWHLLALYAWPVGLSIDHDVVGLSRHWRVAACLLTPAVAVTAVWAWRRAPLVTWAIGWLAICVAPRFVFGTSEFVHEYHLYPSIAGLSVLAGAGVAQWCEERSDVPNVQISPNARA